MSFALVLYLLAILTSFSCTVFLFRGYAQKRVRLLFWSAMCFVRLTINNIFLFLDLVIFPTVDLRPVRLAAALAGM
jgi:hypothetical protein